MHFTCPNGHEWDLDVDKVERPLSALQCPRCGVTVDATGEVLPGLSSRPGLRAAPTSADDGPRVALPGVCPPGYELLRELGRGGMGIVYLARQAALNRVVALKLILAGAHASAEDRQRFLNEAEMVAAVRHDGIVAIYELGTHDGLPYFAMEYCEGSSLAERLLAGPLPPRQAAELVAQLAVAMQAAHAAEIIHRDLKPSNVLLASGAGYGGGKPPLLEPPVVCEETGGSRPPLAVAKITDFGLAKRLDGDSRLTQTGTVMGTASYMAPEQARGQKDVGPLADVYALGAILYECLTARPPFRAATNLETIGQVLNDDPVSPKLLQPQLPQDLDVITLRCLQKDPARRYDSAGELAADLRRYLADEPIHARRPRLSERALRWARKHHRRVLQVTLPAVLSVLGFVTLMIALTTYLKSWRGEVFLTTDGPPLALHGNATDQQYTIPFAKWQPFRPGFSFPQHVSGRGLLSEWWLLNVDRGGQHHYAVNLGERALWPPRTDLPARGQVELLRRGGRTDLVLLDPEKHELALVDGATGQEVWKQKLPRDNDGLLGASHPGEQPGVVSPAPDLDGDGVGDVVFVSRSGAGLYAFAGAAPGRLLWSHPVRNPATLIGQPQLVNPGEKVPRYLLTCWTPGASGKDENVEFHERWPSLWLELVEAGAAKPLLWRVPLAGLFLDQEQFLRKLPFTGTQVVRVDGVPVAVFQDARRLEGIDVATGKQLWNVLLKGQPTVPPVLTQLPGDGHPIALVVQENREGALETKVTLSALSLRTRGWLWHCDLGPTHYWRDLEDRVSPVLVGPDHVAVRARKVYGRSTLSVRLHLVRLTDGVVCWDSPLGASGVWDNPRSDSLQVIAGPDLDGDRIPDVYVSVVEKSRRTMDQLTLWVYALGSGTGRTLWSFTERLYQETAARPMTWWQPGLEGRPQLVVPLDRYSTTILDGGTGEPAHLIRLVSDPRSADLDGDGLLDLVWTHTPVTVRPTGTGYRDLKGEAIGNDRRELHTARGLSPEAWRRMGAWYPVQDITGDGLPDLIGVLQNDEAKTRVRAVSGRFGNLLWRRTPGRIPSAKWPMRSVLDRVFAPPLPEGDLDGDGFPDLIVHDAHPRHASLPVDEDWVSLRYLSGRTGEPLTVPESPFAKSGDRALIGAPLVVPGPSGKATQLHFLMRGLRVRPGQLDLVTLEPTTGTMERVEELSLGQRHLRHPASQWPGLSRMNLGHKEPSLVRYALNRPFDLELRVSAGPASWRWQMRAQVQTPSQLSAWPAPVAGDLDGDGKPEVILVDSDRLVVVRGLDGKELWHQPLPERAREPALDRAPILAALDGNGSRCVVYSTPFEIVVLDGKRRVRQTRALRSQPARAAPLWNCDLDGDGRDEVLFVSEGRVCTTRGGIAPEQETWTWPPAGSGLKGEWAIDAVHPGQSPTVVVRALQAPLVYHVLEGKTGRSRWRLHAPADPGATLRTVVVPEDPTDPPRLFVTRPGTDTIARLFVAAGPRHYEPMEPLAPSADPRLAWPLPWVVPEEALGGAVDRLLLGSFLLVVIVWLGPGWLAQIAWRRRAWRLGLVPILWLATWALGIALGFTPDLWPSLAKTGGQRVLAYLVLATAGLLVLIPPAIGVEYLARRQWLRAGLLLGVFVVVSLLVAGVCLRNDTVPREGGEYYTRDDWYLIAFPGLLGTSVLLGAGMTLRGLGAAWHRWRSGKYAVEASGAA